ncbi:RING-type domain-containing protein [Fusarium sp. LHS14.1]|nr:RING-type domain-containing protein [Fusarium sp. LHS14.1]
MKEPASQPLGDQFSPVISSNHGQLMKNSEVKDLGGMLQHIESLDDTIRHLVDENRSLKSRLCTTLEESVALRMKCCSLNRDIQSVLIEKRAASQEVEELRTRISKTRLQVFESTRRGIIISKLLSKSQSISQLADASGNHVSPDTMDRRLVPDTKGLLDTALNVDQAQILFASFDEWFGETNLETITLTTCSVCHKVKFEQRESDRSKVLVNEFTRDIPRPTCTNPVCSDCYLGSLSIFLEALRENWWSLLGSMMSMPCPCGCSAEIAIRNRGSLQRMLRLTGDRSQAPKLKIYDTAQHLMEVLDDTDLKPTLEARKVAKGLHRHLISNSRMRSPFELRFLDMHSREKGSPLNANFKLVQLYDIDYAEETLRVPIFTRLLQLQKTPSQCSICTELIRDLSYGSLDEWGGICTGYRGDWLWKILLFPQKLEANCNHTIDFCTACLRRHIETQLDQHGRGGCRLLTCPSLGCGRRLEYEEVRLYASDDAFFKYDEYLKMEALNQIPSFRWCLAEHCSSGQIHDLVFDNHVACGDCGYQMCFYHQVKWHEGLTCEEYDSLKENGDPRFQETQDWMMANTKSCPECGINLQKGDGCFHMTCTLCRHQFCWECLASWNDIMTGPRGYNHLAHKDDCYFRSSNELPTQVSGTSVPRHG